MNDIPQKGNGSYFLSVQSEANLKGVDPFLVEVVHRAITLSAVDFRVNEGVRSVADQKKYVAQGKSQTMDSRHLAQSDGYGKAVDLLPLDKDGKGTYDWNYYYPVADAMKEAVNQINAEHTAQGKPTHNIRWGGCWEVINNKAGTPRQWVEAYGEARKKLGKKPFTDGPHFEIPT